MAYTDSLAENRDLPGLQELPARSPVSVLGVPFEPLAVDEAIARVREMLRSTRSHQIVIANAHTLNLAYENPAYREILRNAALVLRDGAGVEIAARLLGKKLSYNFIGTDFIPLMLGTLAVPRLRVFLFGAAAGVAATAGEALKRFTPAVEIVGTENGYVDFESVVEHVQSSQPDIVLVALGNPLQEQWIASNLSRLNARVAIGVGAFFDFLAGRVRRAPKWIRRMRLEWLYRLCLEPRRLWRRYLVGNAKFLLRVATVAWRERS
jgi:exopolysaccharide biosynthesis WecB/TagA/CpsF family protein